MKAPSPLIQKVGNQAVQLFELLGKLALSSISQERCRGCGNYIDQFGALLDRQQSLGHGTEPGLAQNDAFAFKEGSRAMPPAVVDVKQPSGAIKALHTQCVCRSCISACDQIVPIEYQALARVLDPDCPVVSVEGHDRQILPVISATTYEGITQRLIRRLKYDGDQLIARDLGALLARALSALPGPAEVGQAVLVAPVPLHWRREWQRGYNQADLVARNVARLCGWLYCPSALRRVQATRAQYSLTKEQRIDNVAGAFRARKQVVAGQCVYLVDDVYTSGATLSACAGALYAQGAHLVVGATVARAVVRRRQSIRESYPEIEGRQQIYRAYPIVH